MRLRTQAESANLSYKADGDSVTSALCLDCGPTPQTGILEIGDGHVFAAKRKLAMLGQRKSCDLRVWVKERSKLTHESIDKIGLSASKIGELYFVPPSNEGQFFARPAALEANVFVSDEYFNRLVSALQVGKRAKWLELEIEKQGALEYGWEPDGSRKIWKLESTTEPSYVDIECMYVEIPLFE